MLEEAKVSGEHANEERGRRQGSEMSCAATSRAQNVIKAPPLSGGSHTFN